MHIHRKNAVLIAFIFSMIATAAWAAEAIKLDISTKDWELAPGLTTRAWTYGGIVPGTPIIVRAGEEITIEVTNHLAVPTNIHWHGLVVPNDQDGPAVRIKPGATFVYRFTPREPGTYWYHPHLRPVLDQLDRGLYAPFIVLSPEDSSYTGDKIFVLDDWYLDAIGNRLPGMAPGDMERFGNIDTVNGKARNAIESLEVVKGGLYKLRFINASTAKVHTLRLSGGSSRVTHLDGHPLAMPYLADSVTLAPGERVDVEFLASGESGSISEISGSLPGSDFIIPVRYGKGEIAQVSSPFIAPVLKPYPGALEMLPDFTLTLASTMGGMMGGSMMSGMGMSGWTINGKAYPATEPLDVKVGQLVKLRVVNEDMVQTAEGHRMDHPLHIHGTVFQVLSVDGVRQEPIQLRDTIPVPAGGYVDIAFIMTEPGMWMIHCHVIDHEDGGMLTVIRAK
ncbi:MAG: multicopper oxidase family protein [Rectinemataceae bacterium]|nr:multicopper oxidase family protein [Rectinemataceae bacterium]